MLIIDGESLRLEDIIKVAVEKESIELSSISKEKVEVSREYVNKIIENNEVVYGVTTGFGKFCNVNISSQDTRDLQVNLIRSHSAGVGEYLSEDAVRAMMLLRANALAKGYSGIRYSTFQTLSIC